MSRRIPALAFLLIGVAVAVTAPAPLRAQSEELLAARREFREHYAAGRYQESEAPAVRAVELSRRELGPDNPHTASALNELGRLYGTLRRFDEARALYLEALAILRRQSERSVKAEASIHINLLAIADDQEEAEEAHRKGIEMAREGLGEEHEVVAIAMSNFGAYLAERGRFDEAEPMYRQALAIKEKTLGPDHPRVAVTLGSLAVLYEKIGRFADAEEFVERAIEIGEEKLGPEHPEIADWLGRLAALYARREDHKRAEVLYARALGIYRKTFGDSHPGVGRLSFDLAQSHIASGRYEEAARHLSRSLEIAESVPGDGYPRVSRALVSLGNVYWHQARALPAERRARLYDTVEESYLRALAIQEGAIRQDHPELALTVRNLGNLYYSRGDYERSLDLARRATAIHRDRAGRNPGQRGTARAEQKANRHVFMFHVQALVGMIRSQPPRQRAKLVEESFEIGQLVHATSAATALSAMAQRIGVGDDVLSKLVRDRQDRVERWLEIDRALVESLGESPEDRDLIEEFRLATERAELDREIADLDQRLARDPRFGQLAPTQTAKLTDIQGLLAPSEALVVFAVWGDRTFVWCVRKDQAEVFEVLIGWEELLADVVKLRFSVDLTGGLELDDLSPFDAALAHELFQRLLLPAKEVLTGAENLLVVGDEALHSLPLGLLVTEPPSRSILEEPTDYRGVAWLARRHATTVLPSVSSLRSLRVLAQRGRAATRPFIGFGDPVFDQLAPLPDTAGELRDIAASLGAREGDVYLRQRATESTVRGLELSDYRVLAFATHGLVPEDLDGLTEPALALTAPSEPKGDDDGLLHASEITQLDLNADWVVLSACNTAAGGQEGGDGFSGLARAFFYAGSRTLLVSHWPVDSKATVRLTVGLFAHLTKDARMSQAEALRRSMVELMDDEDISLAHPLYWAPFVVVGEGGSRRAARGED